jgi:hypothetical protein
MNVSIARILDLHQAGENYVAFFDHHDDLIIFVGDGEASELSFYQVKATTELTWTPSRLAHRGSKGDLPRSIVGKAYYNVAQFGPQIRRAAILSNRPLNATLCADGTAAPYDGEIVLADLCSEDHLILANSLEKDFPGAFEKSHTKLLMFERVPFDPGSHRDTVLGRIISLLDRIHPGSAACASPFYASLLAEVGRCTGDKTKSPSVAELKKRKSVGRDDLDALIGQVQSRVKTVIEWWPGVQSELMAHGNRALAVERIRIKCLGYWSARRRGERDATDLSDSIRTVMAGTPLDGMDSVLDAAIALKGHGLAEPSSELFDLQSALIVELMESMT